MRAAYSEGNDQVANKIAMRLHQNEIKRVSDWPSNVLQGAAVKIVKAQAAPTLIPPYKGVFGTDLKGACDSHFALRMVHLQQLVGRTAGHVKLRQKLFESCTLSTLRNSQCWLQLFGHKTPPSSSWRKLWCFSRTIRMPLA